MRKSFFLNIFLILIFFNTLILKKLKKKYFNIYFLKKKNILKTPTKSLTNKPQIRSLYFSLIYLSNQNLDK